MRTGWRTTYGNLANAASGVVLALRRGESRRAALTRLRLALRPARGSLAAFGGTPCSAAEPASGESEDGAGHG